MKIVNVQNLNKIYRRPFSKKGTLALNNLSFSMEKGECLGVIGPNGSGKTTLFKCLLGFLKPTSGKITLFEQDTHISNLRLKIGFLYEKINVYADLTPFELLTCFGKLYKLEKKIIKEKIKELLSFVDLSEHTHVKAKKFSKGMIQRLGIALTLINNSELLIFDEPTSGLDPIGIIQISNILKKLREQGKTIILSSHILSHIEDICSDIIILKKGTNIRSGKLSTLIAATNRYRIDLDLKNKDNPALAIDKLTESGFSILKSEYTNKDLEDIFFEIMEKE